MSEMLDALREFLSHHLTLRGLEEVEGYLEHFVKLEAELEMWKRQIVCHWCEEEVTEDEANDHYKTCTKHPLKAENEAWKRAGEDAVKQLGSIVGLMGITTLLTEEDE